MVRASLLKNLIPGYRPIATKSRRYNAVGRKFIVDKIEKLRSEEIIRLNNSRWSAQVLVVKNQESGKKRLIDSQPNKEKEASDSSFAFIKALQCCISFHRIERYLFQMLPYLLSTTLPVLTTTFC